MKSILIRLLYVILVPIGIAVFGGLLFPGLIIAYILTGDGEKYFCLTDNISKWVSKNLKP